MKYIISVDCYLVDIDGSSETLTNPTFDLNFEKPITDTDLIVGIKNRLQAITKYVVIKETLYADNKECPKGTVNKNQVYFEIYVGKTGKEVLKKSK
jgi:hypothetical protein